MSIPPFHLALPVTDLEASRAFYAGLLGCGTGRESSRWIDFDFWGHQVVAHLVGPDDHPHETPVGDHRSARFAWNERRVDHGNGPQVPQHLRRSFAVPLPSRKPPHGDTSPRGCRDVRQLETRETIRVCDRQET